MYNESLSKSLFLICIPALCFRPLHKNSPASVALLVCGAHLRGRTMVAVANLVVRRESSHSLEFVDLATRKILFEISHCRP